MNKILLGGAGGTPTENVVSCLKASENCEHLIGIGSEPYDMILSKTDVLYQVPYAMKPHYKKRLFQIIDKERPAMAHFQNDIEIREVSRIRGQLFEHGTKLYMPSEKVVEICVDKGRSADIWLREGVKTPKTIKINSRRDLKKAFEQLGDLNGDIWLRATVGGGGKGALPTNDYEFAEIWIDKHKGWGNFTAAELLSKDTITWSSIWYEGELVVAQTRKRLSWNFGNRTLSGVTGITHVGLTLSDEIVNKTAIDAINAIDRNPHGIYSVDMAYDKNNIPNLTEINISRFFTTIYFFAKAGLNMPEIFKNIVLYNKFPTLERKINPLPEGMLWVRGMDCEPMLTTKEEIQQKISLLNSFKFE